MRAVAARKRKDVVKTPRRGRRISPWKVAVWAAILAPWAIVASVFASKAEIRR